MQTTIDLDKRLAINPALTQRLLVEFIRAEAGKFGFRKLVLALSGGIDSAVSAYLGAEAVGPENLHVVMMPYATSSPASRGDAQLMVDERLDPARVVELGFSASFVQDVLRRVRGNQYKRMMPIIAKVGSRTPGIDFRYPRDWGR